MKKSIYELAMMAGCELSHHQSDLYLKKTDETQKLVDNYEFKNIVTTFKSLIDHTPWFDIPFAYDPFWERGVTYRIFNATDGIFASPDLHTKESGLKFLKELTEKMKADNEYYLTRKKKKIPIEDVQFHFITIHKNDERF